MPDDREWIVPMTLVQYADRPASHERERSALASGESRAPLPADRVIELRERIRVGHYTSTAMIETVARRILESGDL